LTERSKEAAYGGLQEVRGSMELKGSVVANTNNTNVTSIDLTVATVAGGSSVDLTDDATAKVQITYHDKNADTILTPGTGWTVTCPNCSGAANKILVPGALATIHVVPPTPTDLVAYWTFSIEIKPPTGGVMLIERTLPAKLTAVTDLQ